MNFSPQNDAHTNPVISIIVPARNEEDCIGDCIHSLQTQKGINFELFLVDDGSTDNTRKIATDLGVRILDPDPLPEGWSGKSNAIVSAVKHAKGQWLLFTDADTIHAPGILQASLGEAEEYQADVLSYSPRQIVTGFWQRALMPVVFAELASTYRPKDICNPSKPDAAANGQFILIRADVYGAVGGHAPVAATLLEDLALARLLKAKGYKLRFRMSQDVATRMYRDTRSMFDGWTRNLAPLFQNLLGLAVLRISEFAIILASLMAFVVLRLAGKPGIAMATGLIFALVFLNFFLRIRKAHFTVLNSLLASIGLPLFALLLVRSHIHYRVRRQVMWKGRNYRYPVEVIRTQPQSGTAIDSSPMRSGK